MADSAKTKHIDSDDDDLSSVMDVDEVKEIKVIQNRVVSDNGSISSACSGIVTAVVLHEPGVIVAGREGHQWRDGN